MVLPITRRQFNAAALSTAFLPLISCKKKSVGANALKIGVLLPTSGHQAALGQECKKGMEVAGPVMQELLGVECDFLFGDTESNVNAGRTKAEKLIQEGAHVIVGCYDSGVSSAVAQVCEQRKIPLVLIVSVVPQLTEQGYKYIFRNFPTGPMLIKNGLMLMKDLFEYSKIAPKKAAFIYVKETYGETMKAGVDKILPSFNMPFEIVSTIGYDPKTTDLSTEVAKIKESGADFIIPATRLNDGMLLIKEVMKQKLNIMGIANLGGGGMYEKEFFNQMGDLSNHWISNTAWYNPKAKIVDPVSRVFAQKYPDSFLETSSMATFEAIHIACDAFKRAGSTNPQELRDALAQTNIEDHLSLGGPIQFDEKGQGKNVRSASMQNSGGRPRVIFPVEAREADPVFPIPSYTKA